jgi:hypothetical protein
MKHLISILTLALTSIICFGQSINYNNCTIYTGSDPNTGLNVDDPNLPRSMWVNRFCELNNNDQPLSDRILCVGNWLSNENLYQEEKDFLDYVTTQSNNQGAEVDRLLLYSISYILDNSSITPDTGPNNGPQLTLEEHLARFIGVAKQDYNLEIEAILPANYSHDHAVYEENNYDFYDFTLSNSMFVDDFQHTINNYTGGDLVCKLIYLN